MKKSLLIVLLLALQIFAYGQSQTFLSEYWTGSGGEMGVFHRNVTKTDSLSNVYVAGSTLDTNNSNDIIVQKFNPQGTLLWQQIFNGAANMDDMAADIFIDHSLNVYVTGTSIANATDSFDLVVLKYSSSGILQWNYYYDNGGSPYPYDAGTAIIGDNSGAIYVTGSSFGTSSMSDYVTLKLNDSTGVQIWVSRYDFAQLNDVASTIKIDGVHVVVTGGSQSSTNPDSWEMATLKYNAGTGAYGQRRSGVNASAEALEIYDLTLDEWGKVYVTGSMVNQFDDYDIVTYKLDTSLNIIWERQFNSYGNEDKGCGVKVDSQGNVYVAGYVTSDSEGKNYSLLKYNSAGTLQWSREFNGQASTDDEAVQLVIDDYDRVFVTGSARNGISLDYQTIGYLPDGRLFTQISYDGVDGLDDKPCAIATDLNGNLIVVGQEKTADNKYKNTTIKYSVNEKPIVPVYIDSVPSHNKGELIIRFDRSAIKFPAIDKKKFEAGLLNDFVKTAAITGMSTKLGMDVSRFPTFKIFRRMTTADTISITRLGDTVQVDDFWATLSVFLPDTLDEQDAADSLNTLTDIIWYAERDYFGQLTAVPDDPLYANAIPDGQTGLFDSVYGINVENAWDMQTGRNNVKVGVYDSGIYWQHEDFGDGTWAGTKIVGGWDFYNNVHPSSQNYNDLISGHGTAVAGIIGALRNNGEGIAGIAGGDVQNGNTGAQLFSISIPVYVDGIELPPMVFVLHSISAPAIVEGAMYNPNTGYGYGFHIQNHSWNTRQTSYTLRNAVKTCYQQSCHFIASSGNYPKENICAALDCITYPASYKDEWVMKVGANDSLGIRAGFSVYGTNLDFIAPGTLDIYATLNWHTVNGASTYTYQNSGTSFAAPHVAGVDALLYSQHNTVNGYPNNLAPEDAEQMLQNFATGVTQDASFLGVLPVPNNYAAYGRINAALTLQRFSLPRYFIKHAGGQSGTPQTTSTGATVILPGNLNGLAAGTYYGDRYQITQTFVDVLAPSQTVIGHWPRFSSSQGLGQDNPVSGDIWFGYTASVNQNVASITTTTYCWHITQNLNFQTLDVWIPAQPSQLRTTYSLYVEDLAFAEVKENTQAMGMNVYPNPSDNQITLDFNLLEGADVVLQIIDATGRMVAIHNMQNMPAGKQTLTLNLSNLPSGLYLCNLTAGNQRISKRIVKN